MPLQNAREELSDFINESESRALVLFHSPSLSPVSIREVCLKFGVLYYIRPEFHNKGVTLLSYFDLRCALRAHTSLGAELLALGDRDSSVFYSILLHVNQEEFKLLVQNIPEGKATETADMQTIFSRFGQLRSILKLFDGEEASTFSRHIRPRHHWL